MLVEVMKQDKERYYSLKVENVERDKNKDTKLSDVQYEENNIKNKHAD